MWPHRSGSYLNRVLQMSQLLSSSHRMQQVVTQPGVPAWEEDSGINLWCKPLIVTASEKTINVIKNTKQLLNIFIERNKGFMFFCWKFEVEWLQLRRCLGQKFNHNQNCIFEKFRIPNSTLWLVQLNDGTYVVRIKYGCNIFVYYNVPNCHNCEIAREIATFM